MKIGYRQAGTGAVVHKDAKEAAVLAGDLKGLNDSRKDMTAKAVETAIAQVEEEGIGEDKVLVLYLPDCHEVLQVLWQGESENVIIDRCL